MDGLYHARSGTRKGGRKSLSGDAIRLASGTRDRLSDAGGLAGEAFAQAACHVPFRQPKQLLQDDFRV